MPQSEISSDLIKLTLRRLIKNKANGEYKGNLLSGIAHARPKFTGDFIGSYFRSCDEISCECLFR